MWFLLMLFDLVSLYCGCQVKSTALKSAIFGQLQFVDIGNTTDVQCSLSDPSCFYLLIPTFKKETEI